MMIMLMLRLQHKKWQHDDDEALVRIAVCIGVKPLFRSECTQVMCSICACAKNMSSHRAS
jgi:hypothetical protein